MNEKQQQLTFDKGITNVPSDAICSDNTLEESVGMIYDDGEHRVIQKPKSTITGAVGKILYIHKYNDINRYIHLVEAQEQSGQEIITVYDLKVSTDGVNVNWLTNLARTSRFYTPNITVTSVGKTLVVNEIGKPLTYYLWNNIVGAAAYVNLGRLPEPQFDFWMVNGIEAERQADRMGRSTGAWQVFNTGKADGIIKHNGVSNIFQVKDKEDYNNLVVGLYAKNKKSIKADKHFCCPFFIRTALELYDGTYTHVSQPILMIPSETENTFSLCQYWSVDDSCDFTVYTIYSELHFRQTRDLTLWNDVVKNIVVFMSDDIEIYNTLKDQPYEGLTVHGYTITVDGIFRKDNTSTKSEYVTVGWSQYFTDGSYFEKSIMALAKKEQSSILNDIKAASVFYRVCGIGLEQITADTNIGEYIDERTLTNLTTQEMLEEDDYFSRSTLCPNYIYAYNSRLNFANTLRSVFEGYGFFMPFDNASASTYDFYVEINTGTESVWVHHSETTTQKQGIYFYYPDARADRVVIKKNGTTILNEPLTEHTSLNGAYFLKGLPGVTDDEPTSGIDIPITVNNDYLEALPNYIIQSEVNNPWVFKAAGYFQVGTGKIIGMSTITQALSQGQYGQYPLLVFSESGIWALSVASTGYYSAIHPMSREVCNNAGSITQTDGAVFFTSEKGLMVVVGSDVKCVSEQLSGLERNFTGEVSMGNVRDYMKDCFIAYDYRDSLLWIFNNSREANNQYCYVYAIKTGTFGKYQFSSAISNVVNDYPDYLLQSGSTLFSLTGRRNINLDTDTYTGLMITRPMKLENGLALKSLMQIRHIKDMQGTMTMRIYASNNLTSWTELHSLRGMPWKYYRFRYDFAGMKATDRFTGTMLITQERRTDKLR